MSSLHGLETGSNLRAVEASQQEPLVPDTSVAALNTNGKPTNASYMSLPRKGQLAVLCIARFADPLASASIQSYMFYQLKFFDPSATDATISTRAGFIIGARTAAQVFTGLLWGRLADSDWGGRKAVLITGLLSSSFAHVGYGFASTFSSAVTWQAFGGAMNSNVAMVRCVVAEINPEKRYRTRALLLLPLCANAGMLLGPLVGGLLSSGTRNGSPQSFPYAAPNLFVAAVYAVAAVGVLFSLEETLESLKHAQHNVARRLWDRLMKKMKGEGSIEHSYTAIGAEELVTPSAVMELGTDFERPFNSESNRQSRRVWTFNVGCTMLAHFIIAGHLSTFANLWAIFLSTPVGNFSRQGLPFSFNGGLGMQPRDVGFAISLLGAIGVVLQAAIYPMLNDRYGTLKIWRYALFVFPVVYVLAPFPALVASGTSAHSGSLGIWLSMSLILLLFVFGRTGVTPATTLLINECTPHPSVRGTIHTAGTVIGNLSRSLFPIAALAIFGKGQQIGVVGLGFWCLACLAILACVASRWVREGSNED